MKNRKSITLDESGIPRENNKLRIDKLASILSESGFKELAEIILNIGISCPNYASQTTEANVFLVEMTLILHGLNSKDLEKYIDQSENLKEQREHQNKIVFQAATIIKNLYVSEGIVMIANVTID